MAATLFEELSLGRHLFAFSLDPTRLDRLERLAHAASNIKDPEPSQAVVSRALRHPGYRDLARRSYAPPVADLDALERLPEDTLGGAYARFMKAHGLDVAFYRAPKSIHPGVSYLAERYARIHDISHVLTGYPPSPLGELALQAFDMAQLPSAIPAAVLIAGLLHLMRRAPSDLGAAMDAIVSGYTRGAHANLLVGMPWEERFEESLHDLRLEVGLAS